MALMSSISGFVHGSGELGFPHSFSLGRVRAHRAPGLGCAQSSPGKEGKNKNHPARASRNRQGFLQGVPGGTRQALINSRRVRLGPACASSEISPDIPR